LSREYFVVTSPESAARSEVGHFVAWLVQEAKRDADEPAGTKRCRAVAGVVDRTCQF
jgi:hypothetical protein